MQINLTGQNIQITDSLGRQYTGTMSGNQIFARVPFSYSEDGGRTTVTAMTMAVGLSYYHSGLTGRPHSWLHSGLHHAWLHHGLLHAGLHHGLLHAWLHHWLLHAGLHHRLLHAWLHHAWLLHLLLLGGTMLVPTTCCWSELSLEVDLSGVLATVSDLEPLVNSTVGANNR